MRRLAKGTLGLAAIVTLLSMMAASPSRAEEEAAAKGRELAQALCARCHLNDGQGEKEGPMGVPGFVAVANRPKQTYDGVVRWLEAVPPMMPDHRLTQDEIDALAAFIMSLRKAP